MAAATGTASADAGDHSTNPFAPRQGKALVWRNVNMTVLTGSSTSNGSNTNGANDGVGTLGALPQNQQLQILRNVWGEVPSGETTAIMGPSGAGKTSVLNILAGRLASKRGRLQIDADIRLDHTVAVDPTKMAVRKLIAFVAQDDSLPPTSTPREAIWFSAKLRLPRSTKPSQINKLTNRMLLELGLRSCADTIVGGPLLQGISGGERKRTSVGVELVTKPALVFLDEPTSGLDSHSAVQLIQVLKKVARSGASVLFTIHQPSSQIFNSFDHLILMNRGRVMYQGTVQDVPRYLKARGYPLPPNYNPADWIMELAQTVKDDQLDASGFYPSDPSETGALIPPKEEQDNLGNATQQQQQPHQTDQQLQQQQSIDKSQMHPGFLTQTYMLFYRELVNISRDVSSIAARFVLTFTMGMLIGTIFFGVGKTDPTKDLNLQSHFGALLLAAMTNMFGNAMPALLAFPQERPVFLREYSTNHYSAAAYFVSRFTMEAIITAVQVWVSNVITYFMVGLQANFGIFFAANYMLGMASAALAILVGCSVEDPKMAQEFLPLLFVPQLLFAGFFVAPELIPAWLRWAQYLCTLTYALRILLVAEFQNCGDSGDVVNEAWNMRCNSLVQNAGADPDDTWWYWIVLTVLFAVFRIVALLVLRKKASKFF